MTEYTPVAIADMRKRLGLSQTEFANLYKLPIGTLRNWEQGRTVPDAGSVNYLFLVSLIPVEIAEYLSDNG